jgi:hypothetical protein
MSYQGRSYGTQVGGDVTQHTAAPVVSRAPLRSRRGRLCRRDVATLAAAQAPASRVHQPLPLSALLCRLRTPHAATRTVHLAVLTRPDS